MTEPHDEEVTDILVLAAPAALKDDMRKLQALTYLNCVEFVYKQYESLPEEKRPQVAFRSIRTLVTSDLKEVDDWPLEHDCDSCREGINRARALLKTDPDVKIVLANMDYLVTYA